ncbi:MAG: hypothetical protein QOH71_1386 [Blastocatellia bacterium]|jgi:hypothetical protein|nr:hypothetical protein [Blastocatellia bacterium]
MTDWIVWTPVLWRLLTMLWSVLQYASAHAYEFWSMIN